VVYGTSLENVRLGALVQTHCSAEEIVVSKSPDDAFEELHGERNRALADSQPLDRAFEAELRHRVLNVLAVVRSIFSRTIDNADSLDHVADHFRGRLDSLAHLQFAGSPRGFNLEDMIHDALMVYVVIDDPRVTVTGPETWLNDRTAETVGLAIHELATNSIKFGVLSPSTGRGALRISWAKQNEILSFEWLETGIAIVSAAPLRSGFGREYIEQALPYQTGGESSFELSPGRLRCTFSVPLSETLRNGSILAS
jgi:two-component sensor histidine kinase